MDVIQNVQSEVLFVGSFFAKPILFVEYGRFVVAEYDLSDEVTKFLYNSFELYYTTFSQTVDEMKINTFMSQCPERLKTYKKYGGYKTIKQWSTICDVDDFPNYMETVKKYSLLREYSNKGYNVSKIMEHKKFNSMKAKDIYRIVRSGADRIGTMIMANEDSIVVNKEMNESIIGWIDKPSIGILTPYEQLNNLFRGFKTGKMLCNAMLSNAGKSRFMILLAAFIALVKEEKVLVLANEMGKDDFKSCLLTTVINNTWFKELHGVDIEKPEREIVLGKYRDRDGEFMSRMEDEFGEFTETMEEYIERLKRDSDEYNKVMEVSSWIESNISNKIYFKQLFDYSDEMLDMEIRKHKLVHGVNYVFYDTLKPYMQEDWGVFKQTCTKLYTLATEIDVFIYGSVQMTDDTHFTSVFSLSSNNIASAKSIKHVLDMLMLSVHLKKEEYHKYKLVTLNGEWGESAEIDLDVNKRYVASVIDKNRLGDKDIIPVYEINLNLNTWVEVGHLIKCK